MAPRRDSLLRQLGRDYLRHRLYGPRHRPRGGWMAPRRHSRYVLAPRPRSRVQVRGCGCCLPIPLGFLAGLGLGARLAQRKLG